MFSFIPSALKKDFVIAVLLAFLSSCLLVIWYQNFKIDSCNLEIDTLNKSLLTEKRNSAELNNSLEIQNKAIDKLKQDEDKAKVQFVKTLTAVTADRDALLRKLNQQKPVYQYIDCKKQDSLEDANKALNLLLDGDR